MKTCTKCKQEKSKASFNKLSKAKDGLQYHCKECKLEHQRNNPNRNAVAAKYRNANKAECSRRSIRSQQKNQPYYTAKATKWQKDNYEHYLSCRRKRYQVNRAEEIARVRRRQGRIRDSFDSLSLACKAEIDGYYQYCSMFKGFEVDHTIPLNAESVSGLHVPQNLQVLSIRENRSKGNKYDY